MDDSSIQRRLEDYIVKAKLAHGDRLPPEKQLVAMLNVSRSALREALRSLEARGLLTAQRGSGRFLRAPDISEPVVDGWRLLLRMRPAQLLELLEIRHALELRFLPRAVDGLEAPDVQALSDLVTRMEEKARDDEVFGAEDREFHELLFSRVHSELLEQLLRAFWDLMFRVEDSRLLRSDDLVTGARLHRQLVEAVAARDVKRAEHYLDAQFYDVQHRLEAYFGKGGGGAKEP